MNEFLDHAITVRDLFHIAEWSLLSLAAFLITLAFLRYKPRDPNLQQDKGGHNDLSKWENFGGTLKRPPPPSPITTKH